VRGVEFCSFHEVSTQNNLEEAFHFIERTTIEPGVTAFGVFLQSCGLHDEFEMEK